ncbi:MAG: hypothetical protein EXS09_09660 [Gemmataceae bacterium]|nr:hypothetical protein [Gemmataceae bacterium]
MRSHFLSWPLLILAVPCLSARGQDKNITIAKLKETAADAMKKSEVKDANLAETDNLIFASTLPEAKAKSVADSLQKTYLVAAKALKFEDAEVKGFRAVVYAFGDVDQFRQFQRAVLKTRPDPDSFAIADVKRDVPFLAITARRGEKAPNFEVMAGNEICKALLSKKGGNAKITEWMKDGFARAVKMRSNPASVGTDRSAVSRIAPRLAKTAKGSSVVDKAWSGTGKDKDLVAASLMDFLTFGAGAEKLSNILNGLIPGDGGTDPTFGDALKASDWMLEDLDRAWRDWLAKGAPANK